MIKAIVTDLDDTLLRYDKTISEFTIDTLKRCSAAGIKLIFATARGASYQQLVPNGLFDARVLYNGAIAEIGDETVYSQLIAPEVYSPFLREMDRLNLRAIAEIGGMHHANFDVSSMWPLKYAISDFTSMSDYAEKLCVILDSAGDAEKVAKNLPSGLYLHFTKAVWRLR